MTFAEHFPRNPYSKAIATKLNAQGRTLCEHGRSPCVHLCGVYWNWRRGSVDVIPEDVRLGWLARVSYLTELRGRTPEEALAVCKADPKLVALVGAERLTLKWQDAYTALSARLNLRSQA